MKNSIRYWCIVPAAGVGQRMGASHPKQYLKLSDKTVCEHTLLRLLELEDIERVIVCLSAQDDWWQKTPLSNDGRIDVVPGGAERCDSVLNGLSFLEGKAGENDWVLVHDVARPCVRVTDIQALIDKTRDHSVGGLLAAPVRDTMKRANASGEVETTVCRDNLWHALTPQIFRFGVLKKALSEALQKTIKVTDEASAIEWAGGSPLLVEGCPDNIKITHPDDLQLAKLYLQQQALS